MEDCVRFDRRERVWEVVDWMHLAINRDQWRSILNTVLSLRIM
jgi:hypothetical protein